MTGLLLSEWTKLRSVSRWVITMLAALVLTTGLSVLTASANATDANTHRNFVVGPNNDPVSDTFYFVHQPMTGDTTLTVRVASLTPSREPAEVVMDGDKMIRLANPSPFAGAAAGIMIKDGTTSGSSYAAVMLTSAHGVRMQSDYTQDHAGSASDGTRWLRLVRAGGTITGYESADGTSWTKVGTAKPKNLPATAEIGFYVSSAPTLYFSRGGGSSSLGERGTDARATFDGVVLNGASQWKGDQIARIMTDEELGQGQGQDPQSQKERKGPPEGSFQATGSGFAVTGNGKVGPQPPEDDIVEAALIGVLAGIMALICIGALFATSEYRRGMIRSTFAATPRRGQVLAAKAIVIGVSAYALSLIGVVGAFLFAVPAMRKHGFAPPAFPTPSLTDPLVLRALLLTAGFMALVTVFAMAVGMLLRRSAIAITLAIVLVLLPVIVGTILPGSAAPRWVMYTTLAGGLATQRAKSSTTTLAEPWAMIGPWAGLGVTAAYAALALGLAWWQLRRRDS